MASAVFRRRGVIRNVVVPSASVLFALRDDYFHALGAYRQGSPGAVLSLFARSAQVAATLIDAFYDHPVMGSDEIESRAGTAISQAYREIDRLVKAEYIEEITGRKKNRGWVAAEPLAELDELDRRIQAAMLR